MFRNAFKVKYLFNERNIKSNGSDFFLSFSNTANVSILTNARGSVWRERKNQGQINDSSLFFQYCKYSIHLPISFKFIPVLTVPPPTKCIGNLS